MAVHAETDSCPLAVVGMALRFPGADDPEALWRLLVGRGDAVRPVPADRWDAEGPLDPEKQPPTVGAFLDRVDLFDPGFFGISPREAESIDPQQRLALELAWRALEDAGVRAADLAGSRTGVYVGASWHDYELLRKDLAAAPTQHSAVGTAMDMISARVSYFLKLTGPSMTVETGCSSALTALSLAAQALRAGDLAGALVGGVNLMITPGPLVELTHFGGLSPTGRCHAFSAEADGFARGEGGAVLYLKTLERALADGDRIHGVVAGVVANNDGGGDSLVTPSPAGQEDLLRRAYTAAGVHPDQVAYVEAHGTGTRVGDPIEASAIGRVLGQARTPGRGRLPIGSVKTNLAHLESAAGMAGLVKALLVLRHRMVPPNLHAEKPNPDIPFEELNLAVAHEPIALPEGTLHAGVNSFGWGGTNVHVILRSAPADTADTAEEQKSEGDDAGGQGAGLPLLLPLSAHSTEALRERAGQIARLLEQPGVRLSDAAGALAWRRDHFPVRAGLAVADRPEAVRLLDRLAESESFDAVPEVASGRADAVGGVAFVFPGQGSQWAGMGRALYAADPVFAASIDRCADALDPLVDWDLRDLIRDAAHDAWTERLDQLQPVLWAVSVSLAEVWRDAGVEPDVVIGHSQGEVSAATVAGILSVEDAARVVARRSTLARRLSGRGLMLAVDLDADAAQAAIAGFEESVALAVHNGPSSCVLSGERDAVLVLKELLEVDEVFCRLVNVDYASHSPQIDELEPDLAAALAGLHPRTGRIPLRSTVRGGLLDGPEMDAGYWFENLRRPVRFAEAMEQAFDDGVTHVVEISPHPILTPALERLAAGRAAPPAVLATLRRDAGSPQDLAGALARGYAAGLEPFGRLPRRSSLTLPGYPWQRRSFWPVPGRRRTAPTGLAVHLQPAVAEPETFSAALEVSVADSPWLRDHRVFDAVVVPGALMLELAVRTAAARLGAAPQQLADLEFISDLTLTEEPASLAVRWRDETAEAGAFTLVSLSPGATAWTTHARARFGPASGRTTTPPLFPAHLMDVTALDADSFYQACAQRGLNYGPAFQGVLAVHPGHGEALAELRLSDLCRTDPASPTLHAALWDAALQTVLTLLPDAATVVPTGARSVRIHQDLDGSIRTLWAYALDRGELVYDIYAFDEQRQPVFTVEGLRLATLEQAEAVDFTPRMHRMVFADAPAEDAEATGPARWLVCAAPVQTADADELVSALADATQTVRAQAATDPAAWPRQLAELGEHTGIVFLAPDARAGLEAQRRGLVELTALVRAATAAPAPPQIVVVTRNATSSDAATAPDPGAALYWGYGRVLRREHPETAARLIDLPAPAADRAQHFAAELPDHDLASAAPSWARDCAAELLAGHSEDQVVLRDGRRSTGLLVSGPQPAGTAPEPAAWRTPAQPFRLAVAEPGLWEGLSWRPLRRRPPGPDEVEIEIEACALNFIDVMKSLGVYPDASAGADRLGGECAGRIAAVGSAVNDLAVGDRVVACAFGALASHTVARAAHTRRIPEAMGSAEAAALPLVLCTAWYALHDLAGLGAGETVLVHSAAGGLGLAAIQVARLLGAEVIATAGTEDKRAYLRGLGVTHVFDSRDLSWADGVRAATAGHGVDVVLNSLAGAAIERGLEILAEDGRFLEVGKKDVYAGRQVSLASFAKGTSFAAVDLAGLMDRRPQRFADLLARVWEQVERGALTALPTAVHPWREAPEALRTMSRGSHIGKLVLHDPVGSATPAHPASSAAPAHPVGSAAPARPASSAAPARPVGSASPSGPVVPPVEPEPLSEGRLRPDACYLITGGLGALGLSLAEHFAALGAGALLLVGRSVPTADATVRIEALRSAGTVVHTAAADVADRQALDHVLAAARRDLPPLRGVAHAAGLLDDATIATLTEQQLEHVLAPKIDGARHLHAATRDDALDLFVLFSSAATLVGNPGQAAYCAANAYLDSLAQARRAEGLPALSVQWGPFLDIGLAAADDSRGARLAGRGMGGFAIEEAWSALDHLLSRPDAEPVVAYVPLDLRLWFDAYPDTAALASFSGLREASRAGGGTAAGAGVGATLAAQLRAADVTERRALLDSTVRHLAGQVLRLDPGAIEGEAPFKSLGLDSLMGLELRNRLEAALGLALSPTLLWSYGSIQALAAHLAERFTEPAGTLATQGAS